MLERNHSDWLRAYMDYTKYSEAPTHMHFWTGVSVIAAALRRKVWIDQIFFKWYPNFYIILVAPPAVVAKSTTAGVGYKLLKDIEGINLGPDIVTWQSLVTTFAGCQEEFYVGTKKYNMSAVSLVSSELGNLLDPADKKMVDLFIKLWDAESIRKETKHVGVETIEDSWINMLACTTPSWIAENIPEAMVKGGLTSRCLFVYADRKARLVAYPSRSEAEETESKKVKLVEDLKQIAKLKGEYKLSEEAYEWGKDWYDQHSNTDSILADPRYGGYSNRKQSHIHKLAMVLAASQSNELVITAEHLQLANVMVSDLESDMMKVFSGIGRKSDSIHIERFLSYVQQRGIVNYQQAYQFIHAHFPNLVNFENMLAGLIKAGYISLTKVNNQDVIKFIRKSE